MDVIPGFVVCSKEEEAGAHVGMKRYRYRGPTVPLSATSYSFEGIGETYQSPLLGINNMG